MVRRLKDHDNIFKHQMIRLDVDIWEVGRLSTSLSCYQKTGGKTAFMPWLSAATCCIQNPNFESSGRVRRVVSTEYQHPEQQQLLLNTWSCFWVSSPKFNMVSTENDTQKEIPNLQFPSLVASKPLNLDIPSHSHIASGEWRSPNKNIQQEIHFVAAILFKRTSEHTHISRSSI